MHLVIISVLAYAVLIALAINAGRNAHHRDFIRGIDDDQGL